MKEIGIGSLKLRYFKGIRQFELVIDGNDVSILGDNGTGKTTLFDSFTYLMFDKDSQNKSDFSIKTLDQRGNALEKLDHEVECVLIINGKPLTLRKVYYENWTKKRGSARESFTGHIIDRFIDGVPKSETEYKEKIAEIVSEDVFKLLTNPMFFNDLHWKKRRETLLDICGDVSNEDVIASNKDLNGLTSILGDRSIEDHRKMINVQRANINDDLKDIPKRIDENERSMPDLTKLDKVQLQHSIDKLKSNVEEKEAKLARIRSGGEITAKQNEILVIDGELQTIKNQFQSDSLGVITSKQTENHHILSKINDLEHDVQQKERQIRRNEEIIGIKNKEVATLRQNWTDANSRTFQSTHASECVACGQALPAEQVQAAHDKAEAEFNREKSDKLEHINSTGKAASDGIKRLELENSTAAAEIEELRLTLLSQQDASKVLCNEIDALRANIKDVEVDPTYMKKRQQKAGIELEIIQLNQNIEQAVWEVKGEIAAFKDKMEGLEEDKLKFAQAASATKRIEELKEQERTLADEYERLEQELYLTEEFIRTKVSLLESNINSKFKFAKFKLFKTQINGGLEECCETTFNGVPFGSGLNNGARINVGLDIICTLSEHYGVAAPIFIDNAEGVVDLFETNGQQIRLVVSGEDKKLRIETAMSNNLEQLELEVV